MIYTIPFQAVALSTTPGTFKTVAGIIVPAGAPIARAAVARIVIGPADASPFDRDLVGRLIRAATAGTPGTALTAAQIAKSDPAGRDPVCTGGINYSAEPGSLDTYPGWLAGFNDRSGIDHPFTEEYEEVKAVGAAGVVICLQVTAMASTATATVVSGCIKFREY